MIYAEPQPFHRLQEVHNACRRVAVSWALDYQEADGSWRFAIRSQAPSEDWDSPKDRSFGMAIDEVLEYLASLMPPETEADRAMLAAGEIPAHLAAPHGARNRAEAGVGACPCCGAPHDRN